MSDKPQNAFDDTDISLQSFAYGDLTASDAWGSWTPTLTGWTSVGTPVVSGRFHIVGKQVFFQVKVVPGTTCATVAGTSYISLPFAAKGLSGAVSMFNATANTAIGTGGIDVANSRGHLPAQVATGNTLTISAWFEI